MMWAYIASYGKQPTSGVYGLEFDEQGGTFAEPRLMAAVAQSSFLTKNAAGTHLFATLDHDDFDGNPGGGVASFTIDAATRAVRPINRQRTGKGGNCYVGTTPDARNVLTADYGGAEIALVPAKEDGTLLPVAATVTHHGHGPNKDRQEKAHAHCFISDPAGRFALCCDLGTDEIYVYRIDTKESGGPGLTQNSVFKSQPGTGPRHLRFSKDGKLVYVLNELDATMDAFRWDAQAGTLEHLQRVQTLPPDYKGENTCSEVALHPSGQFLFAANRGHNSIATFHIDRDTGKLSVAGHTPCGGSWPRHFAVDPTGRVLMVANERSHNVAVLRIDSQTGALTPAGPGVTIQMPMCVVFPDR